MTDTPAGLSLQEWRAEIRSKWGWFVALGIVLLLLGLFALTNLATATIASVYIVGTVMMAAGLAQIINAFQVRRWGGFFFWLLSGLLYGAAGFFALTNPALAAVTLTLLLAIALIGAGLLRIWSSFRFRPERGWGWMLASGVLTTLVGITLAIGWPVKSLWPLGLFLALDLVFQGIGTTALGLAVRKAAPPYPEAAQTRH